MINPYFGFSCSPFENTLDQRFMFFSECHEEVIAALLYFVREKKSFALVCGDVGTGKTMIVHHLLEKLPRSVLLILVPYPDVEFIEILRYVARVLKINAEGKAILELTDDLRAALMKVASEGKQVVLVIDEAHLLSTSSLENIRLLSNIEITENKLIQILLIGQSELGIKLRRSDMRQLRQRINVNRVLSPMSASETIAYIDHRLRIAGSDFERCFDPGCGKLIYEMTGGVPRSINRLCDTALLICTTEKGDRVTRSTLRKAHEALNSDEILLPVARPPDRSSYAKKLWPAFSAAALVVLLALGVLGYRENIGGRLKGWVNGPSARKEVKTVVDDKRQLPPVEAKTLDNPPPAPEENSSPGTPPDTGGPPALSSAPESPEPTPEEAPTVKNTEEEVKAEDTASPPGGETGSNPAAPEKTGAEEQIPDKNPGPAQLPGEGAVKAATATRSGTPNAAQQGVQPEKRTVSPSAFFIVTVQKGESLDKIAAEWFPEDPVAGKKSILAANPQVRNQNRIKAGQALRLPRPRVTGAQDR